MNMTCRSPEAIARRAQKDKERRQSPEYRAKRQRGRRKPCERCGDAKGPGRARRFCDACIAAGIVWCPACETSKDRSEFHATASRSTGVASYCKVCAVTRNREGRYGFQRGELARRIAAQDGRCAACRRPVVDWHIDHDHACCPRGVKGCGKCVRDLLCSGCNIAIGLLNEDVERARGIADYLTRWKG